jgi:hypothetical protein
MRESLPQRAVLLHLWLAYFALLSAEFADGHDAFLDAVRRSIATALNYAIT